MISTILDKITPINNLESQIGYFKAAFETDFNEHFPTLAEIRDKSYKKYNLKLSQIIFNLLILFNSFSGKILLLNDGEATKEVLIYINRFIKDVSYWTKYKKLKRLLKRIIEIINICIPYKNTYITKVNDNFNDAIDKLTSKELYDIIIKRLEKITKRDYKENKAILNMYDIYYKLLRRNTTKNEYRELKKIINEKVPKQYDIYLNGRKDYLRTLTNFINKIEEIRDSIKKDEEAHKETTIEEEQKKAEQQNDIKAIDKETKRKQRKEELDKYLNNDFTQPINNALNKYKITITEAYISNEDLTKRPDIIDEIENATYESHYTDEEEIYKDLEEQILENSAIGEQISTYGFISFTYEIVKEEYHANISGDCLKVALKCYNIDFDGRFEDVITNEEILDNIGFYDVDGYFMFGNNITNDKILLYEDHAVAINTDFKRKHTKDNSTTRIITCYEFNDKIDACISKNIPYRCFVNKINKGFVEIFESDSDFNKYDKPITGEWIKYKYVMDGSVCVNMDDNQKIYYASDSDDEYYKDDYIEDLTDIEEYYKEMETDEEDNTELTIDNNYFTQMENCGSKRQHIRLQKMDYEYIDKMKEAREEFIKLSSWFNNKIIEQCEKYCKKRNIEFDDKYINKHKFDIITPVFPYDYRKRCSYTKFIRGEGVLNRPYDAIDMYKSYLTAFKKINKIYCISNIPMKEMMNKTKAKDYIIFVKSDIVYNGFYTTNVIEYIKELDKNATFEYYRIYNEFDIDTDEITINNYKIVFGMLISKTANCRYKNATNDYYINDIRADFDYNALLHINIMIRRNVMMLFEVFNQYQENTALPKGYVVDSILYDTDDNIEEPQIPEYFKDVEQIMKYNDVNPKYTQKYEYHFGVAGSGKSTELIEDYREKEVVIVNNYNLYRMYREKGINVILWQRFLNEHQSINAKYVHVDEIFTFLNTDIEKIFYMCNIKNIGVSLYGDYNQLEPVIEGTWKINKFKNCLRYVEHDYKYKNYRNTLEYDGKDAWIMDIYNSSLKDKRKEYIERLINAGFVNISNKGKTIRFFRDDARDNEKIYNGKYYMINNYSTKVSVPSKLKLICQSDVLYTKEELKEILGDEYNKYKRYFVNNNCVSFYNTQGQTLKHINIINKKTIDAIAKSGRMFYVFVSRLQGDINV